MMLWTAWLLGLAGSLHCAGMCGPLALAVPSTGRGRLGFAAGRLAYQAGRLATYSVMGIFLGVVGRSLALAGVQRWASVAAGLLILAGLGVSSGGAPGWAVARGVQWLKRCLGVLLGRRTLSALFLLGGVNGLLPCGLVYSAGAGAVAAGGWWDAVAYMGVFGLGTVPMMLAIGLSGRALSPGWRGRLQRLAPWSVGVVGVLLVLRGLALGIPYLSPDLAAGACCH
ncbi:MAG: sulfite exporter TauE/SafE family protein [Verrucomicrobiota bacterium]